MKLLPALILPLAAGVAAWIAWQAPERNYEPATLDEPVLPARVPIAITATPAAGEALRVLTVEGMCCAGCTAKLYARLSALPDVRSAAVDFERGLAQALVPADLPPERLSEALTFDKYSAALRP